MRSLISTLLFLVLMANSASAKIYIGQIQSEDLELSELSSLNTFFIDVWSENNLHKAIDVKGVEDVSEFVVDLGIADDDKFVTGFVLVVNGNKNLRIDVYNNKGIREHVTRTSIGGPETFYSVLLNARTAFYSPNGKGGISSSGVHRLGWSLELGSGINPSGYKYVPKNEVEVREPANLAITNLLLTDLIGTNRDVMLNAYFHYNWRAALGIGMGVKKMFFGHKSYSPSVGLDVGLNKQIIQDVMGEKQTNYVGSRDGLQINAKAGMVFFRDLKRNIYFDIGYTKILSERDAEYPFIQFGVVSTWRHTKE